MTLLLDTNVLVYATASSAEPLVRSSRALIERIANGTTLATTTPEVLQELMHVLGRSRERAEARDLTHEFERLLSPLVTVDQATIRRAADEWARRSTIDAFDAVLVALVQLSDELELVTADKGILGQHDLPTKSLESCLD
jgi:predicted nucleic acid-binding protein